MHVRNRQPGIGGGATDAEYERDREGDELRGLQLVVITARRDTKRECHQRRLEHRRRSLVDIVEEFVDRCSRPRRLWKPQRLVQGRDGR